jgi:hypothetical protein
VHVIRAEFAGLRSYAQLRAHILKLFPQMAITSSSQNASLPYLGVNWRWKLDPPRIVYVK